MTPGFVATLVRVVRRALKRLAIFRCLSIAGGRHKRCVHAVAFLRGEGRDEGPLSTRTEYALGSVPRPSPGSHLTSLPIAEAIRPLPAKERGEVSSGAC